MIDPALLRPGRLDVLLYVGVAEDSNSKLKVLQALTRKFALEADIDLPSIAAKCPTTFTGADMYALSSDAWMTALKRTVAEVSARMSPEGITSLGILLDAECLQCQLALPICCLAKHFHPSI